MVSSIFFFWELEHYGMALLNTFEKRFVIISFQRCGSTFLTASLNSHSDICCAGELFVSKPPFLITTTQLSVIFRSKSGTKIGKRPESYIKSAMQNCRFEGSMFGFKLMHNRVEKCVKQFSSLGLIDCCIEK